MLKKLEAKKEPMLPFAQDAVDRTARPVKSGELTATHAREPLQRSPLASFQEGLQKDDVPGEEKVQRPVDGHADLSFEPWEFTQVDGSPKPPGEESATLETQDFGDGRPPPEGDQLPKGGE